MATWKKYWILLPFFLFFTIVQCFPDPGKFTIQINSSKSFNGVVKNMYNGTQIFIKIHCEPKSKNGEKPYVKIGFVLRYVKCLYFLKY